MSIKERVIEILSDVTYKEQDEITVEKSLTDDLDLDADGQGELAMQLEDEFDIEITDDVADNWTTVQSVIDCVASATK